MTAPLLSQVASERTARIDACSQAIDMTGEAFAFQLQQQAGLIFSWMTYQGFWTSDNFGEKVALIHSEASEMLEANRKSLTSAHIAGFTGEEEEAADILIRLLDLAAHRGWRLGEAYAAKMKMNLTRPAMHGKAY